MAEDSNRSSPQEIDLDNLEVEVVIICNDVGALNQASIFLERRGWPTTVIGDIGHAVEVIAEKRPDFVLISMSHSSQSINRLPDLITQTFNVPCIGFLETVDAMSSARFTQARLRYKIQGKPSGPAIYRTIRKIIAERLQIESDEKALADMANLAAAPADSDVVRIKGGGKAGDDANDSSIIFQKSPEGQAAGKGSIVIKGQAATGETIVIGASSGGKKRTKLKVIETTRNRKPSGNFLIGQDVGQANAGSSSIPTEDLVGMVKRSLLEDKGGEFTAAVSQDEAPVPAEKGAQSLLERAVAAAVNRYCQSVPDVKPAPLEEITYVAVFPVDSPSQPGYLVLVWQAPEMPAREEFLRGCEQEMQKAVAAMNFQGKIEPGFWLQLPGVDFIEWTTAKAEFHFVTAHQKREVGVAFFPTAKPPAKATPAEDSEDMCALKIDDISSQFAVNFKVFIKLKNSGRYFMYLRNGRKIQSAQKERLKARAVDEIYIKRIDLENLRQYLASNHLLNLVLEFKRAA